MANGYPPLPSDIGVMPPPPGVTANLAHPTTHGANLLAANIACLIIAGVFVFLRMYTNIFLMRSVSWDDYVCVLALLLSIAFSVCTMQLSHLGLGLHMWEVPLSTFSPGWLRMNMIVSAIYPLLICLVKSSILLLYIRVLGTCKRTKRGALILLASTFAYCVGASLATIFACLPQRQIWDIRVRGGQCIDIRALMVAVAALNVISDLFILTLPMPLVWIFLQIPRQQKIALTGVFMTGSFVCVVSIVRLKNVLDTFRTSDVTWGEYDSILWRWVGPLVPSSRGVLQAHAVVVVVSVVEVNVGIACACMPTLKLLIRKVFPAALGSSGDDKASLPRPVPLHQQLRQEALAARKAPPHARRGGRGGGGGGDYVDLEKLDDAGAELAGTTVRGDSPTF
ncbi:MAG: hypothetical protein M1826_001523 [Phylliscum demangeonii]|nr:MAG: hypothetical protein M1826_001523 [Phylliscum demangeonii]